MLLWRFRGFVLFYSADAALPLKEAEILDTITQLLKADDTLPEIKCNTLTLTKTICSAGKYNINLLKTTITFFFLF